METTLQYNGFTIAVDERLRRWAVLLDGCRIGFGPGGMTDAVIYVHSVVYIADLRYGPEFAPILVRADEGAYAVQIGEERIASLLLRYPRSRGWQFVEGGEGYGALGFGLHEAVARAVVARGAA